MKLLVTGALRITPEESAELEKLGYEIYFMPDERVAVPDNIPCEEIEAIICNGLFLYTPPDKFPKLRTVQLTSAGLDRVPMDYMDAHGIKVFNARGVYSAPMAEFAVCSVLGFYKRSAFFSAAQSEHRWEKHRGLEEPAADKGDGAYRERRITLRDEGRGGHSQHISRRDNRHRRTHNRAQIRTAQSRARRVRAGAAGRRQRAVGSPERRDNPAQFIRRRRQPRKALFIDNK